uniref:Uncharacterized protein n=1 Tax=Arundo donax TaxID=35708 RepID=A0A0A9C3R5_ARUDO
MYEILFPPMNKHEGLILNAKRAVFTAGNHVLCLHELQALITSLHRHRVETF